MHRIRSTPRSDWQKIVAEQGLLYHTPEGKPYWDESAYYEFNLRQIELLERATNELYEMYLKAAQHVIDNNLFQSLGIPERAVPFILRSWEAEPPSLYGRFDLAYDGKGNPKLLEFNADTPTALIEASIIQWYWKEDLHKSADQFNSIHEKLVEKWKDLANYIEAPLYFCHMDDWEDWMTVSYLRDTASQAGITNSGILMEELGWNSADGTLRDLDDDPIRTAFKLYPWEWLVTEIPAGTDEHFHQVTWIEPIWRMLWSNKGMLAVLWQLYPDHPWLLEAHLGEPQGLEGYARKPLLSREGANVTIVEGGSRIFTGEGPYGAEGYVYQALAPIPRFDGKCPVIGSWYITDQGAAGMGIRESDHAVTDNLSRFIPHIIS